jgi:hypothetical protein
MGVVEDGLVLRRPDVVDIVIVYALSVKTAFLIVFVVRHDRALNRSKHIAYGFAWIVRSGDGVAVIGDADEASSLLCSKICSRLFSNDCSRVRRALFIAAPSNELRAALLEQASSPSERSCGEPLMERTFANRGLHRTVM